MSLQLSVADRMIWFFGFAWVVEICMLLLVSKMKLRAIVRCNENAVMHFHGGGTSILPVLKQLQEDSPLKC